LHGHVSGLLAIEMQRWKTGNRSAKSEKQIAVLAAGKSLCGIIYWRIFAG